MPICNRPAQALPTPSSSSSQVRCAGSRLHVQRKHFDRVVGDIIDVDQTHRLVQEEIFGPVLVAMPFDEIDEVVRLATSAGAQGEGRYAIACNSPISSG